uniref:Uncharacterized protein n=1 Tax=Magallana gigas TaxID=29159 RepID=A0A8W8KSJ4_MAGGI
MFNSVKRSVFDFLDYQQKKKSPYLTKKTRNNDGSLVEKKLYLSLQNQYKRLKMMMKLMHTARSGGCHVNCPKSLWSK